MIHVAHMIYGHKVTGVNSQNHNDIKEAVLQIGDDGVRKDCVSMTALTYDSCNLKSHAIR